MGDRTVIVGAGLAGSLLAVYLARQGRRVVVLERRPDPRAKGYIGGRSINLALSIRGLWGLEGVGLAEGVLARDAIPMRGRMIHSPHMRPGDAPLFQPYSQRAGDAINSVSRGGLNLSLLEAAAREPGVELVFDAACVDVDLDAPAVIVQLASGAQQRVEADLVFGADGAFSPVRARMQRTERFDYSQSYLAHGYKELHIPPGGGFATPAAPGAKFELEPHALHIWPRGGSMMIALPNRDGSFTCTLFWPFEGDHSFAGLEPVCSPADENRIRDFFERNYPDAVPIMPSLTQDFTSNPTSALVTVRCSPWVWPGKVALLGDAAHAIVPFYGQGMNAAFEDVRVLARNLAEHRDDARAALDAFQHERKPHADAIAAMAIENFVEMRDKVGDPAFRYKKRVEQFVHGLIESGRLAVPEHLSMPQYNLVSFSTVPYAEAQRRGRAFDAMLERIIAAVPLREGGAEPEEAWKRRIETAAKRVLGGGESGAIFDVSPALSASTSVFPGDTPLTREVLLDVARGDAITLSTLRSTVHIGAHADGANHYGAGGASIDAMPLERYIGPCQVMRVKAVRGGTILPSDLPGAFTQVRLLLRTGTQPDKRVFNDDFAALSPALIDALAARGVVTLGVDTPSVDPATSKDLPAHAACFRHGIAILEGLELEDVPPGEYELIALPLRLEGFDASPVRAVLRPLRV